jgi:glycosyltransferase involved in cell wall biosynthesis
VSPPRVWFDVSFTRTQTGNIGITRTVRRLFAHAADLPAVPGALAYHSEGFREVPFTASSTGTAGAMGGQRSAGQRLFAWVTGPIARKLVIFALRVVPWSWLRPGWRTSARLTFDALSANGRPVRFQPGDLVVIADVAWNYPAWEAARVARGAGAKVLLLVYDLMPIRHPEFCFPLVPHVFRTFLQEMLQCSDAVACISQATEQDVRAWAGERGVELPPMGFFHLGSDAVTSAPSAGIRPELAAFLRGSPKCFAAVGSFEPKKNYGFLVRVFERLWAEGHHVRLLIAGKETADCIALTRSLRKHPEQGRLLMTLHDASDSEIAAVYGECEALVFPSLFEGFGLPLVEARARGCRVIASDIPAFAELADRGVTLFPRDDATALARTIAAQAAGALPNPGAVHALTWKESAAQFGRLAGQLLGAG